MTRQLWTWREATERALYGEGGFFRRNRPGAHFRTSVHASALFAEAVLALARVARLDTVVDVGAGGAELLRALHSIDPSLALIGVDLADRPEGLPGVIEWTGTTPTGLEALVIANEWLDNVAVDVVELTEVGWRVVLVDPTTGAEQLGEPPEPADHEWLDDWWPAGEVGARAEIGRPRDQAWATIIGSVRRGLAVAVDYAHPKAARPASGTVTGYRDGRQVTPAFDGSTDITSHVALDACAAAGERAGATQTLLTTQRTALRSLGVHRDRPDRGLARSDPSAYVRALSQAGEAAELTDRDGLGGFGWLVQGVGVEIPQALTGTER